MHARGETFSLPALRAHQQHPWHAFLCQLAAMALDNARLNTMPAEPKTWKNIILDLTPPGSGQQAWELVQPDLTSPAFMQPSASPSTNPAQYKIKYATPDDADMLVTTANHRVKSKIALDNQPDDWIMAIITLQTAAGFDAPWTYGIYRMNKGFSNRPCVGLEPTQHPENAVRRDVHALLEARAQQPTLFPKQGNLIQLLWTVPWNGAADEAIKHDKVHPLCIEASRRIRLQHDGKERITALAATSRTRRVKDDDEKGFVTDPWCPMNVERKTSYTPGDMGTTVQQLVEFLANTTRWEIPILMHPTKQELEKKPDISIVARNLTRDQGGTSSYNERHQPVGPQTVRQLLAQPPDADAVAIATERAKTIASARLGLREALQIAQYPGDATAKQYRNKASQALAQPWLQEFDLNAYSTFFDELEQELATPTAERQPVRDRWKTEAVATVAKETLATACRRLSPPGRSTEQSRLRAQEVLERRMTKLK